MSQDVESIRRAIRAAAEAGDEDAVRALTKRLKTMEAEQLYQQSRANSATGIASDFASDLFRGVANLSGMPQGIQAIADMAMNDVSAEQAGRNITSGQYDLEPTGNPVSEQAVSALGEFAAKPLQAAMDVGREGMAMIAETPRPPYPGRPDMAEDIREQGVNLGGLQQIAEGLGLPFQFSGLIAPGAEMAGTAAGGMYAGSKVKQPSSKQRKIERIKEGDQSLDLAQYKVEVDPFTNTERLIADPNAQRLLDKGIAPDTITGVQRAIENSKIVDPRRSPNKGIGPIRPATDVNKRMFLDMIEKTKQRITTGKGEFRPSVVLGRQMEDMFKHLRKNETTYGRMVDDAARAIPDVDPRPIVNNFIEELRAANIVDDIRIEPGQAMPKITWGKEVIGKAESKTKGLVEDVFRRMMADSKTPGVLSSYDIHKFKQWAQRNVNWGSKDSQADALVESLTKRLSGQMNQLLREASPDYADINDGISAIKTVRESMDRVIKEEGIEAAGEYGADLYGIASRKLLTNYNSGPIMRNAMESMQRLYLQTGGKTDFDIMAQANFVRDLEDIFDAGAKSGFEALTRSGTAKGFQGRGNYANDMMWDTINDKLSKVRDKLRKSDSELQLEALEEYRKLIEAM